MSDGFFIREDDNRFKPTDHTRGPWTPDAQHAGPPAALLGKAIETDQPRPDFRVARITFDILRPVPVTPLTTSSKIVRPGRSVELVESSLHAGDVEVMTARAWRIRTEVLDLAPVVPEPAPPSLPDAGEEGPGLGSGGYLDAMETRFTKGSFVEPGPATAWFRMRHPLIADEPVSPLTRVLIAADSGNGISATLDWTKWLFINPDLSVYLHRLPRGEWVCLDAVTIPEPSGVGLAASVIWDEQGSIGRGLQSLFIGSR